MRTILICDDSVTMQQVVRMTFVGEDFKVEAAGDCDEALALAHRISPAVILADLSMPGKTGYDLTEAVRRDGQLQTTPVLLLGSTHEPVDEERARSCGADGHMVKPFESQALIDRVREMAAQPHVPAAAPAEEPLLEIEPPPAESPAQEQPAALSVPEPAAPPPADEDFELEIVMDEPAPGPSAPAPQAAPPAPRPPTPRRPSPPAPALSFSPPPAAAPPFSAPPRPPSPKPASPPPAAVARPAPSPPPAAPPTRSPAPSAPPTRSPAPAPSVFSAPARRPTGPSTVPRPGGMPTPGARHIPGAVPGTPTARPVPGSRPVHARGAQAPSPWVPPPSAAPRPPPPGVSRGPASSTARPVPSSQVRRTPPVPGARPVPVPRPVGPTSATMLGVSRPPGVAPTATPMGRAPVASATRPHPSGGRMSEQDLVARLSKDVIERVVWEVVPELAETIIRQELDRLIASREREPK